MNAIENMNRDCFGTERTLIVPLVDSTGKRRNGLSPIRNFSTGRSVHLWPVNTRAFVIVAPVTASTTVKLNVSLRVFKNTMSKTAIARIHPNRIQSANLRRHLFEPGGSWFTGIKLAVLLIKLNRFRRILILFAIPPRKRRHLDCVSAFFPDSDTSTLGTRHFALLVGRILSHISTADTL